MTQTTVTSGNRRAEDLPDLLTRPQLAEYTGISVQTFARFAVEKKGPRITKLVGAVRYRKSDVLAWLEASAA